MPLRKSNIEDKFAKYRTGPHESIPDPKADNDVPEHISVEPDEEGNKAD